MRLRDAARAGLIVALLWGISTAPVGAQPPPGAPARPPVGAPPAQAPPPGKPTQAPPPGKPTQAPPPGKPAQAPPPGKPAQAPPPGKPAQAPPPGKPAQAPPPPRGKTMGGPAGWNLSDLVDGLIALPQAGLSLRASQTAKIRPLLTRVLATTTRMTAAETHLRSLLTTEQAAFVASKRNDAELRIDGPKPRRGTNEDPVVQRVIQILERRAR